jgi:protein-disulfide isomerase
LIEVLLAIALLNAFATFKLYKRIDSLSAHIAALSSRSAPARTVEVNIDDDEVHGSEDAQVTIVEFTDYECFFCARHFDETHPQIHQRYVETGRVKYVVKDFPGKSHRHAQKAAEAAECAGEQADFWGMHTKLFENRESLSVDNFKRWAREIGLDGVRFDECLDSGAMAEEVKKDVADGLSYGVSGTPVFFINGKMLSGARSFETFNSEIQKALEERASSCQ